jgi:hypothetical protein
MTSLFVVSQSNRLMPYLLGERERERRLPPDGTPLPWKRQIFDNCHHQIRWEGKALLTT